MPSYITGCTMSSFSVFVSLCTNCFLSLIYIGKYMEIILLYFTFFISYYSSLRNYMFLKWIHVLCLYIVFIM